MLQKATSLTRILWPVGCSSSGLVLRKDTTWRQHWIVVEMADLGMESISEHWDATSWASFAIQLTKIRFNSRANSTQLWFSLADLHCNCLASHLAYSPILHMTRSLDSQGTCIYKQELWIIRRYKSIYT
jgi:hypothetical protein